MQSRRSACPTIPMHIALGLAVVKDQWGLFAPQTQSLPLTIATRKQLAHIV
jgi:hypothetical protein